MKILLRLILHSLELKPDLSSAIDVDWCQHMFDHVEAIISEANICSRLEVNNNDSVRLGI